MTATQKTQISFSDLVNSFWVEVDTSNHKYLKFHQNDGHEQVDWFNRTDATNATLDVTIKKEEIHFNSMSFQLWETASGEVLRWIPPDNEPLATLFRRIDQIVLCGITATNYQYKKQKPTVFMAKGSAPSVSAEKINVEHGKTLMVSYDISGAGAFADPWIAWTSPTSAPAGVKTMRINDTTGLIFDQNPKTNTTEDDYSFVLKGKTAKGKSEDIDPTIVNKGTLPPGG